VRHFGPTLFFKFPIFCLPIPHAHLLLSCSVVPESERGSPAMFQKVINAATGKNKENVSPSLMSPVGKVNFVVFCRIVA
jgi:hypothetical protein